MEPLAVALSGTGRKSRERDGKGDLTNVKCKAIRSWHDPLCMMDI
jgi:uncharacterized protein YjhX (UPF0386 family)